MGLLSIEVSEILEWQYIQKASKNKCIVLNVSLVVSNRPDVDSLKKKFRHLSNA